VTAGVYGELSADSQSIVLAVTGDDHELDQAAKALLRMTMLCKKSDPPGMLIAPATWATVTQLAHTFNSDTLGRWLPMPRLRAWIEAEFMRRVAPGEMHYWWGPVLQPRAYQIEAACMIAAAGKFLLCDDPGTGKTVSTVLGLLERQARGTELFPMLIVAPSWDVGDVWLRHIKTWAGQSVGEDGAGKGRLGEPGGQVWPDPELYRGPDRFTGPDILITTYATMRLDAEDAKGPLVKLKARTVVADEVHLAKNETSKQSQALGRVALHADTFIGLTGTPVTRDSGDIFPVLQAMDPRSWPARGRFVKRYLETTDNGYGEIIEGIQPLREPEFRAVITGQYRRVAKKDVLSELPPKIYSVRRIEIPPEWRKSYDTMQEDMLSQLPDGGELPVMSVLAQLTRLGQLASSACEVEVIQEIDPETGERKTRYEVTLKAPSWKADALLGVMRERPGQQFAVFANSKQLIGITGVLLEQSGYRTGYITGGQGSGYRTEAIENFQAGKLDAILCTAGAGSLGITLTAANAVVFLQRSWELDKAIQPEDRAHRMGNEHDKVEIIDILAKDTVDDRVRELMRVKGGQLGQVLGDPRIVRELLGGMK